MLKQVRCLFPILKRRDGDKGTVHEGFHRLVGELRQEACSSIRLKTCKKLCNLFVGQNLHEFILVAGIQIRKDL